MSFYAWALATAVAATVTESLLKASPDYLSRVWLWLICGLAINYGIYNLIQATPSLPAALIPYRTSTLLMRVVISLWMGHAIGLGTWTALGLSVCAVVAMEVLGR